MAKQASGITISFTPEEAEWLAWVMEDPLKSYAHTPVSVAAHNKIMQAVAALTSVNSVFPKVVET